MLGEHTSVEWLMQKDRISETDMFNAKIKACFIKKDDTMLQKQPVEVNYDGHTNICKNKEAEIKNFEYMQLKNIYEVVKLDNVTCSMLDNIKFNNSIDTLKQKKMQKFIDTYDLTEFVEYTNK